MPNQPYMYANFDVNFYWHDLFVKGNVLTVGWDSYYQHAFPLYWEKMGDSSTKIRVPEQFSHNLSVGYSIKNVGITYPSSAGILQMPSCMIILVCRKPVVPFMVRCGFISDVDRVNGQFFS